MGLNAEEKLRIMDTAKDLTIGLLESTTPWGSVDDMAAIGDFNVKFKMIYSQIHRVVQEQYEGLEHSAIPTMDDQYELPETPVVPEDDLSI